TRGDLWDQGTREGPAARHGCPRVPGEMGGAGEVGKSNENGGGEITVQDVDRVAQGAAGVRAHQADERPERGGESDSEEPETHWPGLSEPWSLPGSDIDSSMSVKPQL